MRIVTWNVDGLRAMLQRRNESLSSVLQKFNADIVCLQETKLSKADLSNIHDLATIPGWIETCTVLSAEEGLCGRGTDPILRRVKGIQRPSQHMWQRLPEASTIHNDDEGRCIITDHGSFILVHLYGPAVTDMHAERFPRKLEFYKALQSRLEHWLVEGRHVIILGDLNIAWQPIDNCDWADSKLPADQLKRAFVLDRPDRKWFQDFLDPEKETAPRDLMRKFHPATPKAYTVWGRTHGKRERNFGSRVDYILAASPSQVPSLQVRPFHIADLCTECNILADWQGSDHAPVYAEFDTDVLKIKPTDDLAASGLELESRMRFSMVQRSQPTIAAAFSRINSHRKRKAEALHGSETPPRPGEE